MRLSVDRRFFKKALCATFLVSSAYAFCAVPGFRSLKGAVASPVIGISTTAGAIIGTAQGIVVGTYAGAEKGTLGKRFMGAVTGFVKGGVHGAVNGTYRGYSISAQEMSRKLKVNPNLP